MYEILDYNLKPVMQNALFYIRDSGHFLIKIEGVGEIPKNTLLVKSDVVGLYPSIPHEAGLNALQEALNKWTVRKSQQKVQLRSQHSLS